MSHNVEIWNKGYIKEIILGHLNWRIYLINAFCWTSTPQGEKYWSNRYYQKEPINDDDIIFLKSLAGIKDDPFLLDPENKEFC